MTNRKPYLRVIVLTVSAFMMIWAPAVMAADDSEGKSKKSNWTDIFSKKSDTENEKSRGLENEKDVQDTGSAVTQNSGGGGGKIVNEPIINPIVPRSSKAQTSQDLLVNVPRTGNTTGRVQTPNLGTLRPVRIERPATAGAAGSTTSIPRAYKAYSSPTAAPGSTAVPRGNGAYTAPTANTNNPNRDINRN